MLNRALELYGPTLAFYGLFTLAVGASLAVLLRVIVKRRTKHRKSRRSRWVSRRNLDWLRSMPRDALEQTLRKVLIRDHFLVTEVQHDPDEEGFVLHLNRAQDSYVALCHYYTTLPVEDALVEKAAKVAEEFKLSGVFVVSLSGFTRAAWKCSHRHRVNLIDCARLLSMIEQTKRTSYRRRASLQVERTAA